MEGTLRIAREGNLFLFRGPETEEAQAFYAGLPYASYRRKEQLRTCHATPASAWHFLCQNIFHVEQSPGADLDALAGQLMWSEASDAQPELRHYDAWPHQVGGYHYAYNRQACMLALKMGLGKTALAINLAANRSHRRNFVLCPNKVTGVWRGQVAEHWPRSLPDPVLLILDQKTNKRRADYLRDCLKTLTEKETLFAVTNYEAVRAKWNKQARRNTGTHLFEEAIQHEWDLLIADEIHRISNHTNQQSKGARSLGRKSRYRLGLTGTPMRQGPLDVFGEYLFLDPGLLGTSYQRFKHHYADFDHFGTPTKYKNQDELAELLALMTYEVRWEDVDHIKLPPATHSDIEIELPKKALKLYQEFASDMAMMLDQGDVTATNALVKSLRLRQISSGFTKLDDSDIIVPLHSAKQDALTEMLLDLNEPVIVFCSFHYDLDCICAAAEAAGARYGEVSGRRQDLTDDARMPDDIDVLGVQIASGGLGVNLTRAAVAVYYNHPWEWDVYEQSLARPHRPGQTQPVRFFHFVCKGTIDRHIIRAISRKDSVINALLSYLREVRGA